MSAIRLAIVDDALFVREALRRLLADDPRIEIVGQAATGEELLARLDEWRPDVVTLDLNMPGIGGLATLDRLMASHPLPVIILSTHSGEGAPVTVEALSRGAVDFIDKEAYSLVDFGSLRAVLVEKILHVVGARRDDTPPPAVASEPQPAEPEGAVDLVVIGASTGGPRALEAVLQCFRRPPPFPIAVVQHMPPGFTRAFAERLDRVLPLAVREGEPDMALSAGSVTIAPGDRHMRIVRRSREELAVALDAEPADVAHRPSVDVLFESALTVTPSRVCAVLLTGMGSDGARGMERLHAAKAHTIAQDAGSCVVYGMPRAAVERGAASEILALRDIGGRLTALAAEKTREVVNAN